MKWTPKCGWHYGGNNSGKCCVFELRVILMLCCNSDHAICKLVCHCVLCASIVILDYVNVSILFWYVKYKWKMHLFFYYRNEC
jgi:hypothetical protein